MFFFDRKKGLIMVKASRSCMLCHYHFSYCFFSLCPTKSFKGSRLVGPVPPPPPQPQDMFRQKSRSRFCTPILTHVSIWVQGIRT